MKSKKKVKLGKGTGDKDKLKVSGKANEMIPGAKGGLSPGEDEELPLTRLSSIMWKSSGNR